MSTSLGVAAVTAVLKSLLNNGMISAKLQAIVGSDVKVSALPPDRVVPGDGPDPNQVNVYLYMTSMNPAWRNIGQPARNSSGVLISNPPLALDLHYLVTAWGSQDYFSEIILARAMQVLHENMVLSRDLIRRALSPPAPDPGLPKELASSQLADQVEQIKITPEVLNTEEISRMWTAMGAKYRVSMAYQATVLLIESTLPTSAPLPVVAPASTSTALPQFSIISVAPDTGPGTPFIATSKLVIKGSNLLIDNLSVQLGPVNLIPPASGMTASQITTPLPGLLPSGLYAGVLGVQVMQSVNVGQPEVLHPIFQSNVEAIVFRPTIAPVVGASADHVVSGVTYRAGHVDISFVPNVSRSQQVTLLLNEFNAPNTRVARGYSFPAPLNNGIADPAVPDTASISFPFDLVLAGDYLVRVQVDGAESPLKMVAGIYAQPKVTL